MLDPPLANEWIHFWPIVVCVLPTVALIIVCQVPLIHGGWLLLLLSKQVLVLHRSCCVIERGGRWHNHVRRVKPWNLLTILLTDPHPALHRIVVGAAADSGAAIAKQIDLSLFLFFFSFELQILLMNHILNKFQVDAIQASLFMLVYLCDVNVPLAMRTLNLQAWVIVLFKFGDRDFIIILRGEGF